MLAVLVAGCQGEAPAPASFDALVTEARDIGRREGPRAAVQKLTAILTRAREAGDPRAEALVLGHLGTAYKNLGDYTRALEFHEAAMAGKRKLGDRAEQAKTLSNIGLVHWSRGRCDQALPQFDASLAILDELGLAALVASVVNNRGLCLDMLGRYTESRAAYERAIALHRQHGNDAGESEALANRGGVFLLLGRFADAARDYGAALAIDERLQSQQGIAADLINLGSASLGRGEPQRAVATFDRARDLAARAGLAKEQADATRGRSRALVMLGQHDAARADLDRALAIYRDAALTTEHADGLLTLGAIALDVGDLSGAARSFEAARQAAMSSSYAAGITASLLALARLEHRRGRAAEARRYLDEASAKAKGHDDLATLADALALLAALDRDAGRLDAADALLLQSLGAARAGGGVYAEAEALLELGATALARRDIESALARYRDADRVAVASADPHLRWRAAYGLGRALEMRGDRDGAVRHYLVAVGVIEDVRARLGTSRSRAGFLEDKAHVYTALVSLLIRLGRVEDAFGVAERLRASGFLDLLARSLVLSGAPGAGPAAELLARIEHLQGAIRDSERAQAAQQRASAGVAFRAELLDAERAWREAVDAMARDNPAVAALNRQPDVDVGRLRRLLAPRAAVVQFVVADQETVVFVLTAAGLRARSLPTGRQALAARVELLRGLIAQQTGDNWRQPALRLGSDLIAPLESAGWLTGISTLVIVPHAELHYLPFAVLGRSRNGRARLLIEDYDLTFLPSAGMLSRVSPAGRAPADLLAMAPQPARLPHSAREVERLGPLFTSTSRLLVGTAATEASFKAEAGRHRVVHLATHGFFNRVNPLFSGLELERDAADDGRLQVYEILGLRLRASLVTLSACQTALGTGEVSDVPVGEEFVSLARAFLSAGAGTVMASLWDISDGATPALMEAFYRGARRAGAAQSLAAAQRARATSADREAHPFYWAPFVLVGPANNPLGSVND